MRRLAAGLAVSASPGRARLLPHVASVICGVVIFALLYDPFHAGAVAFLALAPLVLVFANPTVECSLGRAAAAGFAFGLMAAMAIVGPWMFSAAAGYFGQGTATAFAFTLAVNAVYVALFYVPTFMALRVLAAAPPMLRVFGAASTWIAFEALRAASPAGNAWALLGQALANVPLLREAAAYGGVWTLGAMAALCGSAAGVGLQPDIGPRDAMRCTLLALLAPLTLAALALTARNEAVRVSPLPALRVAIVQAQVPAVEVWNPATRMNNWQAYVAATETIAADSVDLVVWPESAAPFLLDADAAARSTVADLAARLNAAILLGAPRSAPAADGRVRWYNSAWFFAPGAEPRTYDKRRLLPFAERSLSPFGNEPQDMDYAAGQSSSLFDLRGWRIAPLLCFEAVYPQYARQAVADGATLLVNLSNDAWFSGGAGPEQHWSMSLLRTVELRRPMIRAANGGVSGAIAPDGTPIGFPIRRQKAVRVYEIAPPPRMDTMTATSGEFVPKIAAAISLLTVAAALVALLRGLDEG